MKAHRFFIALSLAMSMSTAVFADMDITTNSNTVTIKGTVPNAKGEYVNIIVQSSNGDLIYVGQEELDSQGSFSVQYEPPEDEKGEHRVTVVSDNTGDKPMVKGYVFGTQATDSETKPVIKPSGGGSSGGGGSGGSSSSYTSGASNLIVAQIQNGATPFLDIANHWAKSEIENAYTEHWISGVSETMFAPDTAINRAELATLLVRKFNITSQTARNEFLDISDNDWFEQYISILHSRGIVDGYGDVFLPKNPVTRQEAAKMIMLASGKRIDETLNSDSLFSDDTSISDWAKPYIYTANRLGIIKGKDANVFDPEGRATRAEIVVMLSRID